MASSKPLIKPSFLQNRTIPCCYHVFLENSPICKKCNSCTSLTLSFMTSAKRSACIPSLSKYFEKKRKSCSVTRHASLDKSVPLVQRGSPSSCCIIFLHVCNSNTPVEKKLGVEGRHVGVVSRRHRAGKLGLGRVHSLGGLGKFHRNDVFSKYLFISRAYVFPTTLVRAPGCLGGA